MEAIVIDINDYEHSGEGANGQSLYHKTNPDLMIKLYNLSAPKEIIINELELAHKVYDIGIPTPKPGELITDGNGRLGIRFQRIVGKKSISKACGECPENVEKYARRFARLCLQLHSKHLNQGEFRDIKQYDLDILNSSTVYTPREKEILKSYILNAPDGDTAIHGDLQFGNAIMVDDQDYLIDLGDFACGSPLFDLGMVLFTCRYENLDFLRNTFHMEPETANRFWIYFVKEYFGEDADPDEKERELRPYAALKLLIIERNVGSAIPAYHWMIQ